MDFPELNRDLTFLCYFQYKKISVAQCFLSEIKYKKEKLPIDKRRDISTVNMAKNFKEGEK
jgi:hypothetical protein